MKKSYAQWLETKQATLWIKGLISSTKIELNLLLMTILLQLAELWLLHTQLIYRFIYTEGSRTQH